MNNFLKRIIEIQKRPFLSSKFRFEISLSFKTRNLSTQKKIIDPTNYLERISLKRMGTFLFISKINLREKSL
jgi:hypothetical protein